MNLVNPRILVAACGNRSAGDDAFGPLVAERLDEMADPAIEVVDLGMKPAALLNHLGNQRGLIIVDAAIQMDEFQQSTLIDLDFAAPNRPALVHDVVFSSHGLSIDHQLQLAAKLEMLPSRIHLIAVAASSTDVGLSASPFVLGCIQPAADRIVQLARDWQASA
jgi:hydrogenase maturation protease